MHEQEADEQLDAWFEDAPRAAAPSALPILIGGLVFLLVLLAGAIAGADWAARNLEMRSLLTAIESSEAAMGIAQDEIVSAYQAAQKGGSPSAISDAAGAGRDAIAAAGRQVASVRIAPWHAELLAAQGAYLRHNRSWQEYLDRMTEDVDELGRPQAEIDDSFAAAEPLLRAAVPVAPLFEAVARIDKIFAPTPGPDEVVA